MVTESRGVEESNFKLVNLVEVAVVGDEVDDEGGGGAVESLGPEAECVGGEGETREGLIGDRINDGEEALVDAGGGRRRDGVGGLGVV